MTLLVEIGEPAEVRPAIAETVQAVTKLRAAIDHVPRRQPAGRRQADRGSPADRLKVGRNHSPNGHNFFKPKSQSAPHMICVRFTLTGLSPKPRTRPSNRPMATRLRIPPPEPPFYAAAPDRCYRAILGVRPSCSPSLSSKISPAAAASGWCSPGFVSPAGRGALVLTGANGSGKSSLLRLLATLLAPAAAGCCGERSAGRGRYRSAIAPRLHYVGHLDALKPALTPRETLGVLGGAARRRADPARSIDAALAAFGSKRSPIGRAAGFRPVSGGASRSRAAGRGAGADRGCSTSRRPRSIATGEARLEQAIAAHRAAGGMVVDRDPHADRARRRATLALDDFAPPPDELDAVCAE